jgi:hypothetical protein
VIVQKVLFPQTGLVRYSICLINFIRHKFRVESILPDVAFVCQIFHDHQLRAFWRIGEKQSVYQFEVVFFLQADKNLVGVLGKIDDVMMAEYFSSFFIFF